ncbi:MAG: hypothetical protein GY832_22235 [Chloroflexi bacterium]|nr:hypothetical protein [Chloroflexota bacterium]
MPHMADDGEELLLPGVMSVEEAQEAIMPMVQDALKLLEEAARDFGTYTSGMEEERLVSAIDTLNSDYGAPITPERWAPINAAVVKEQEKAVRVKD